MTSDELKQEYYTIIDKPKKKYIMKNRQMFKNLCNKKLNELGFHESYKL